VARLSLLQRAWLFYQPGEPVNANFCCVKINFLCLFHGVNKYLDLDCLFYFVLFYSFSLVNILWFVNLYNCVWKHNACVFDSNITFTSPVAVCRYLTRAAASASSQTLLYGADILQQAEVYGHHYLIVLLTQSFTVILINKTLLCCCSHHFSKVYIMYFIKQSVKSVEVPTGN